MENILKIAQDLDAKKLYSQSNDLTNFSVDLSNLQSDEDFVSLQKKYASLFRELKKAQPDIYSRLEKTAQFQWAKNWWDQRKQKKEQEQAAQSRQRGQQGLVNVPQKQQGYAELWNRINANVSGRVAQMKQALDNIAKVKARAVQDLGPVNQAMDHWGKVLKDQIQDIPNAILQVGASYHDDDVYNLVSSLAQQFSEQLQAAAGIARPEYSQEALQVAEDGAQSLQPRYDEFKDKVITGDTPKLQGVEERQYDEYDMGYFDQQDANDSGQIDPNETGPLPAGTTKTTDPATGEEKAIAPDGTEVAKENAGATATPPEAPGGEATPPAPEEEAVDTDGDGVSGAPPEAAPQKSLRERIPDAVSAAMNQGNSTKLDLWIEQAKKDTDAVTLLGQMLEQIAPKAQTPAQLQFVTKVEEALKEVNGVQQPVEQPTAKPAPTSGEAYNAGAPGAAPNPLSQSETQKKTKVGSKQSKKKIKQ